MRWSNYLSLMAVMLISACAHHYVEPLDPRTIDDPALAGIADAYERLIASLRHDPETTWHAGWRGNVMVHVLPGPRAGLCVDWQREVYFGLRDEIASKGWRATPIAVRVGTPGEHHAVLVHDPASVRLRLPDIVHPESLAFVLDPWKRGQADIFPMSQWLRPYADDDPPFLIERLELAAPDRDAILP